MTPFQVILSQDVRCVVVESVQPRTTLPFTVAVAEATHPLQSVTDTEYVPAVKLERSSVVAPLDQAKVYALAVGSPY